ncbi:MAG: divalent-cation tolerance protein CutA [Elusimicrobia bacterium]|nr:divalent-cation tolerance protein CutA [Elusimicrobiota bacterium]
MKHGKFIQIITTSGSRKTLEKIAEVLVEERLAACVQITGKARSIYRWKGNAEHAEEYRCLIKTRKELFDSVEKVIKKLHNYETPEIIAVDICACGKDYAAWLDQELKHQTPKVPEAAE